jgi:putative glycosyltransferase
MSRDDLDALLSFQEREIFISGLWQITGFHQVAIPVLKHSTSDTTYTFRKKIALVINAIVSFSDIPLKAIFYVGCVILLLAVVQFLYLFILRLAFDEVLSGWASLMASIWLLGGMIIAFLGIIGIYLSKIFLEVKRRPLSIIRQIYFKG